MTSNPSKHNLCMSWLNAKNKSIQCNRQKLINSDFCRYHKKTAIYFPNKANIDIVNKPIVHDISVETLDNSFSETLFGMYDSWGEIPKQYWIKLNNRWWDIRILANIFSEQLCTSEMQKPKPSYPHDPFNRKNFTPDDLTVFKDMCSSLDMTVYIGLKHFLLSDYFDMYLQEYGSSHTVSSMIIDRLEMYLRYKLINNKNSQDSYIGLWVPKEEPLSNFESLYIKYDNIPMQIISYNYYYGQLLVDNPARKNMKTFIDALPQENSVIESKYLVLI